MTLANSKNGFLNFLEIFCLFVCFAREKISFERHSKNGFEKNVNKKFRYRGLIVGLIIFMLISMASVEIASATTCNSRSTSTDTATISPTTSWQTVSGSLSSSTATKRYKVTVSTSGQHEFSLCSSDGGSCSYDSYLCLFDSNGGSITSNDDTCGTAAKITYTLSAGTYYVQVSGYGSNYGSYTLSYRRTPSGTTCNGRSTSVDAAIISPTTNWQTVSGSLSSGTDTKRYKITVSTSGQHEFSLCSSDGGSCSYDSWLCLLDSNGGSITSNDDTCGTAAKITYTLSAGTYYVHVSGYSSNYGSYTLSYRRTPVCPSGQTYCSGTCVNLNTDVNNCGSCGYICPSRANAQATCSSGTCSYTCNSGYGNCDNNWVNGCEINLNTNQNNCGSCGNICPSGTCQNGQCVISPTYPSITNSGFESDTAGWIFGGQGDHKIGTTVHSGAKSALIGFRDSLNVADGKDYVYQSVYIPFGSDPILSFWYDFFSSDACEYDYFNLKIRDNNGNIVSTPIYNCMPGSWGSVRSTGWTNKWVDLGAVKK